MAEEFTTAYCAERYAEEAKAGRWTEASKWMALWVVKWAKQER